MRSHRGAWVLVVLLVALLGAWWTLQRYEVAPVGSAHTVSPAVQPIVIRHSSNNGVHTYEGELELRPCDSFSTQMQTENGDTTQLTFAFVVTPGSCTDPVEPTPFTTSFSSSEKETPVVSAVRINMVETPFVITKNN